MQKAMRRLLWLSTLLLSSLMLPLAALAQIVHEERSLYRNILVQDRAGQRCLLFSERRADSYQTCMDLQDPDRIVFSYVRMMFSGLLIKPDPQRILLIGLGGGTMPPVYESLLPGVEQDLVEIDPAVVQVARDHFGFRPSAQMRVHERDARVFVKRALLNGERWDMILLDAFTADYIPEHLLTREFLEELQEVLSEDGVVVANTFATSRLYHHESATYRAAFPNVAQLRLPESQNRIFVGTPGAWPDTALMQQRAEKFAPRLEPHGVDIRRFPELLNTDWSFDRNAQVLTDQYSPANLLQGRSRRF